MWNQKMPIRLSALLLLFSFTCFSRTTHAAQLPHGYAATHTEPQHDNFYRYPVPQRQFFIPAPKPMTQQQFQQQLRRQQGSYAHTNYQQQQQHYVQQQTHGYHQRQQQQQQRQQYRQQAAHSLRSYYQQQHQYQQQQQHHHQHQQQQATAFIHSNSNNNNNNNHKYIAQKFAAPDLENAAFTAALTSQGHIFGGVAAAGNQPAPSLVAFPAASVSSARALPASLAATSLTSAITAAAAADANSGVDANANANAIDESLNSNALATEVGSVDLNDASINLKLPLPVNIAPIKVSPLPLQKGASFKELAANGVTSYGTTYPQRKRR